MSLNAGQAKKQASSVTISVPKSMTTNFAFQVDFVDFTQAAK